MKRVLLVANVAKEHVLKFHMPTVKELKKRGWTVDVACADEDEIPGCDQRFIMSWKRSPLSRKTLGEIRRLRRIIEDGNYDIVYCHTPMGGLASRLASIGARRQGTKVIYCVHGFHCYEVTLVKRKVPLSHNCYLKAPGKSPIEQSPALATLLSVDQDGVLPTV